MQVMERRVAAAQATLDAFFGRTFKWGEYDCARLAAHTLRGLGHKPRLARGGRYSNALGATRALKRLGYADLADALDALGLPRLKSPAHMLPGDIGGFRHPDMPTQVALVVAVGRGRMLGFGLPEPACCVFEPKYGVESMDYMAWQTL